MFGKCEWTGTTDVAVIKNLFSPISREQHFEDDKIEHVKFGKLIPQPRINLVFENGKIGYWNGK